MMTKDYTPIYDGDRYCLMCRWACPVERITKREATSPHGWALLIASQQRGLIDWNAETVDTLYQCADCGLCQANCATDRPLPAAIVAARAGVVEGGAMPDSVRQLDESLQRWGNPYAEIAADAYPFNGLASPRAEAGAAIGLFVGAETYWRSAETVRAAQTLLRATAGEPVLLSIGRSGVYLPYTVGLWGTARLLARQTLDEIAQAGVRQVLTLSKEDTHTFQHIYPELEVAWPEEVVVQDFAAWLIAQVEGGELHLEPRPQAAFVYHDPCHTPRLPGSEVGPRALVAALTGAPPAELFWRERRAAPCGAVGGFLVTQPGLAADLARARLAEARATGAALLVTEDPHCAAHLAHYADGLRVTNLIELVAEQMK
jgi:Fe-S oxidoreductase